VNRLEPISDVTSKNLVRKRRAQVRRPNVLLPNVHRRFERLVLPTPDVVQDLVVTVRVLNGKGKSGGRHARIIESLAVVGTVCIYVGSQAEEGERNVSVYEVAEEYSEGGG